jgi:hypothetical protein
MEMIVMQHQVEKNRHTFCRQTFRQQARVSEAAHFRGEHVHNNKRIENNAATAAAAATDSYGITAWYNEMR